MRIAIGADHGGFEYKTAIIAHLKSEGHEVIDCGTYSLESCNYPDFAIAVGEKVASKQADLGVVLCRSGEGLAIAANKVKGVRCGIGYNKTVARLIREHNDANMISFGADFFSVDEIIEMLEIFMKAEFLGDRHQKRVQIIIDYENK